MKEIVTVADRFNELLKQKGISAYKCSEDTGVDQGVLSRLRNGKSKPDKTTRKILANYFGVSVGYLMCEEERPKSKIIQQDLYADFKKQIINFLINSDNLELPYLTYGNSKKVYTKKDLIKEINNDSEISLKLMNNLIMLSMELLDKGDEKLKNFEML